MKNLLFLSMFLISVAAGAQTNFSGSYSKISIESLAGPKYGNALPETYTIQQTGDSLIIIGATSRSSYAMNGGKTSGTSATSNRKFVRSLSWSADKKSVTLTNVIYVEGDPNTVDLTRVNTWTLSEDGKQLLVDLQSIETRSENWHVKGVFSKH